MNGQPTLRSGGMTAPCLSHIRPIWSFAILVLTGAHAIAQDDIAPSVHAVREWLSVDKVNVEQYWLSIDDYEMVRRVASERSAQIAVALRYLAKDPVQDETLLADVFKIYALQLGANAFPLKAGNEIAYNEEITTLHYGEVRWRQFQQQILADGGPKRLALLLVEDHDALETRRDETSWLTSSSPVRIDLSLTVPEAAFPVLLTYSVLGFNGNVVRYGEELCEGLHATGPSTASCEHPLWPSRQLAVSLGRDLLLGLHETQAVRFQLLPARLVSLMLEQRDEMLQDGDSYWRTWSEERSKWFRLYCAVETNRNRMTDTIRRIMALEGGNGVSLATADYRFWSQLAGYVAEEKIADREIVQSLLKVAITPNQRWDFGQRAVAFETLGALEVRTIPTKEIVRCFTSASGLLERTSAAFWLAAQPDDSSREKGRASIEAIAKMNVVDTDRYGDWRAVAKATDLVGRIGCSCPDYSPIALSLLKHILDRRDIQDSHRACAALIALGRLAPQASINYVRAFLGSINAEYRLAAAQAARQFPKQLRASLLDDLRRAAWDGRGAWGFLARIEAVKAIASAGDHGRTALPDLHLMLVEQGYGPVGNTTALAIRVLEGRAAGAD